MDRPGAIVVFHTAFVGDIVLTLPMIQVLRRSFPQARICVVAVPASAAVLQNNPAIDEILAYDKRGRDRGIRAILRLSRELKKRHFDVAIVPHRSLRSAAIIRLAGIPQRLGFSSSAGRFLFTRQVEYRNDIHEVSRNLSLLGPLGITPPALELPALFPSVADRELIHQLLTERERRGDGFSRGRLIGVAPGSVWNTKRWPREKYEDLCRALVLEGASVVLIGGGEDAVLCRRIANALGPAAVLDVSGKLSLLQSAAMIAECKVLVTNDSAPSHIGVAMKIPVVAIFGATAPAYGFAPLGAHDVVVETNGLTCRPCAIHGGEKCPIGTFDCMMLISPEIVLDKVHEVVHVSDHSRRPQ